MAPILVSTELRTYDTELTVGLPRYVWSDGKRPSQWDGTSFDEPQMEVRSSARCRLGEQHLGQALQEDPHTCEASSATEAP